MPERGLNYMYKNLLELRPCVKCLSSDICFLRKISLNRYPEHVQEFVITTPNSAFSYQENTKQWYANYQAIQERIVEYYNSNDCGLSGNERRYLTNEMQKESDRQKIRELFKRFLDAAAKATEDKNPEISIMFEGIGLVLASDYLEAVSKIFSMFKTLGKVTYNSAERCFGM